MPKQRFLDNSSAEFLLTFAVLVLLVADTVSHFVIFPYPGFRTRADGEVIIVCTPENGDLQSGDYILEIDGLEWSKFASDPTQSLFDDPQANDLLPIVRQREERIETIEWRFAGFTTCGLFHRTRSEWWVGYLFWLAGLLTVLHIRPRDERRLLLIGFFFINALWLNWGGAAWWNVWGSYHIFRFAAWLAVPIYWHVHWIFPRMLTPLPRPLLAVGYGAVILPWLAELAGRFPKEAYQAALLLAFGGALLILCWRLWRRPGERRSTLLLLTGYVLAFGLGLAASIAALLEIETRFALSSIITITAIPGTYFHAIVREQFPALRSQLRRVFVFYITLLIGTIVAILLFPEANRAVLEPSEMFSVVGAIQMSALGAALIVGLTPLLAISALARTQRQEMGEQITIRANPLLAPFLFLSLLVGANVAAALLLTSWLEFAGEAPVIAFIISLSATLATWLLYPPFRRLVNRHLLGIRLSQRDLLSTFATRLSTSPDRQALATLLREEILPSLLIRQSQLFIVQQMGNRHRYRPELLLDVNVPDASNVPVEQIEYVLNQYEGEATIEPAAGEMPGWVRVALPLWVGEQLVGLWLLGERDPGDLYEEPTTRLLRALANQMAIALANIVQTENLQRLYRANIDRNEAERGRLARELHDEVLNQLASVTMFLNNDATTEQFDRAYAALTQNLRRTISGLRPAMLAYGLPAALEELRDDVQARRPEQRITLDFENEDEFVRYPPRVEEYLFRIAQQAVENALLHAGGSRIAIEGTFAVDVITLRIEDDGRGFPAGSHLDLSSLLAQRHFGIAGMYERAALIDASLQLESAPGAGTVVSVRWRNGGKESGE